MDINVEQQMDPHFSINSLMETDTTVNATVTTTATATTSASPLSLNAFPTEILTLILSHVDTSSLSLLPLVCRKWNSILSDDAIWHSIFTMRFSYGGSSMNIFSSISKSSKYRIELLYRMRVRQLVKRGKLTTTAWSLPRVIAPTSVRVDWNQNSTNSGSGGRVTIVDIPRECITVADVKNGRGVKEAVDFVPEGVTSLDIGSRVMVFGRWDGSVAGALMEYKGLLLGDAKVWGNMVQGRITAVCACVNVQEGMVAAPSAGSIRTGASKDTINSKSRGVDQNLLMSMAMRSSESVLVSSTTRTHTTLVKAGMIGAFSCDESGSVFGWDIRNGDILYRGQLPGSPHIARIQSDGKTVVVTMSEDGALWVIRRVFENMKRDEVEVSMEKIGQCEFGISPSDMFVDYGGECVVTWDSTELCVFSFAEGNVNHHRLSYKPPGNGVLITAVSFEATNKMFIKRRMELVGTDPLLAAVVLNNGLIEIVNIRESPAADRLTPMGMAPILPKFLSEHENSVIHNQLDENKSPVAAVCITSVFVAVASHLGKVEVFDAMTGEFLRTVVDRVGNKKIQELENMIPNRMLYNIVRVYMDDCSARGLLMIGPHVHYFFCGDKNADATEDNKKKIKSKKRFNDKKGDSKEDILHTVETYEVAKAEENKAKLILQKYNGDHLDEDEQLDMAMVMSMSLNESTHSIPANETEEDKQLREALELSLLTSPSTLPSSDIQSVTALSELEQGSSNHIAGFEEDIDEDEELRRAIELSKLENSRNWEDYQNEEQWEALV